MFGQNQRPRTLSKIVRNLSNFNCGNVVKHGLSSLHPIQEGGVSGIRPYESLGFKGFTSYFCMFRFIDSECIVVFCGFSLEGVNVVLQMLDLLCKLKNDVKGLKVYGEGICLRLVKKACFLAWFNTSLLCSSRVSSARCIIFTEGIFR